MTGADPPQEDVTVPLGVARGDGRLPAGVALHKHFVINKEPVDFTIARFDMYPKLEFDDS
jgi:hypothetical protein